MEIEKTGLLLDFLENDADEVPCSRKVALEVVAWWQKRLEDFDYKELDLEAGAVVFGRNSDYGSCRGSDECHYMCPIDVFFSNVDLGAWCMAEDKRQAEVAARQRAEAEGASAERQEARERARLKELLAKYGAEAGS